MGVALERAALSPNIRERRDYSCALTDGAGRLIAQAAHIPVHLGSMALAVRAAIAACAPHAGDAVILNDPFAGGTHLPDITLVLPVFVGPFATPLGYLAVRAHHADVGGEAPGSMGLCTSIEQEGVRIPPTLVPAGAAGEALLARLVQPMRAPAERLADLRAQRAACELGARRLTELAARHGQDVLVERGRDLCGYAARLMRAALAEIPDGRYAFADALDDDGLMTVHGPGSDDFAGVVIRVVITKSGDQVEVDFSDSAPQTRGPVNAPFAVTLSAVLYAFRLLLPRDAPTNDGLLAPITVIAEAGSVVAAEPPAAVAGGNVETSQRIVDVVLGALARALPGKLPAASAGSMSNLSLGDPAGAWAYYETIPGGAGATAAGPGAAAVQTHMTNTRNTPLEELEHYLPIRMRRYAVRRGSGGAGSRGGTPCARNGGDGVIRELELLAPATVSLLADRRRFQPYGLGGGAPGLPGEDWLAPANGSARRLPSKLTFSVGPGDVVRILTPGGGGYGDPRADLGFSKAKLLAGEIKSIT